MVKIRYSGSQVKMDIALFITEMEMEVDHLINRLALQFQKDISSGVPLKDARQQLLSDIKNNEVIYGTFVNSQKAMVRGLTNALVAKPVNLYAQANPKQKFSWVLGSVKTVHCPDCLYLSQQTARTIDEWRELGFGLPREASTECSVGCKCQLLET